MPPLLADDLKLPLSNNTKNIIMKVWDDLLHIVETILKWDKGRMLYYTCIKQPSGQHLVRYSSLVSENPSVVVPLSQDYFNEDLSSYILINLPVYYGKIKHSAPYSAYGIQGYFLTKEPSVALVNTNVKCFDSQYHNEVRQEIRKNINTITYVDSMFLEVHYDKDHGCLLGKYDLLLEHAAFERLLELNISIAQDLINYANAAYNVHDMFHKYWFERKYAKYGRFVVRLYYCFVPEKEKFYQTLEFALRTDTDDPTRMISTNIFYILFDQEDITKMRQDDKINRIFESLEDYAMQHVLQSIIPEYYYWSEK